MKESPRCKAHVRQMYVHTTYIFTYMSGSRVASIVPNNRPRTFHILYIKMIGLDLLVWPCVI